MASRWASRWCCPPGRARPGQGLVPRWLQVAGGWAWRLLFIGIVIYLAYRVAGLLALVVIPCAGALLLTALLQPLAARLHRAGLPMMAATWCTLLGAVIVLAGTITLVTIRVRAEYKGLVTQVRHTSHQVQAWLAGPPLHLKTTSLQTSSNKLLTYLGQHKSLVAGTVLTGEPDRLRGARRHRAHAVRDVLPDQGRHPDLGLADECPRGGSSQRANRAGRAAWQAVVFYVRGTVLVAAIHAVVIGSALTIMGVPLVAPLAVLVFLAAFIPLVGILFAGSVIILITLATKGWIAAVILFGIFIAENQIESHLLQPQVVGRIIRLHPLAIILVLAVGGIVAGIPGAVVAVPVAAAITRAVPELRRRYPPAGPVPVRGDSGPDPPHRGRVTECKELAAPRCTPHGGRAAWPGTIPVGRPWGSTGSRGSSRQESRGRTPMNGPDRVDVLIQRLDPGLPLPAFAIRATPARICSRPRTWTSGRGTGPGPDRGRHRAARRLCRVRAPALRPRRATRGHDRERAGHGGRRLPRRDQGHAAEHRPFAAGQLPARRPDRPARHPAGRAGALP